MESMSGDHMSKPEAEDFLSQLEELVMVEEGGEKKLNTEFFDKNIKYIGRDGHGKPLYYIANLEFQELVWTIRDTVIFYCGDKFTFTDYHTIDELKSDTCNFIDYITEFISGMD